MAAIAAASGVSKPVLYDHFPSKEALFAAVLESVQLELIVSSKAAVSTHQDPEGRMRAGVAAFFDFVGSRPTAARVMFVIPRQEAEAAEAARDFQRQAIDVLTRFLRPDGTGDKQWLSSASTEFFRSGLHGLVDWWAKHPEVPRESLVEIVMDLVWRGLAAGPNNAA